MAWAKFILIRSLIIRVVADFSRPWGVILNGGRFARFAWCWGQAESRTSFLHYRFLSIGPIGVSFGRRVEIQPQPLHQVREAVAEKWRTRFKVFMKRPIAYIESEDRVVWPQDPQKIQRYIKMPMIRR